MADPILHLVGQAHALTETAAATETDARTRKQYILADVSLHLVQAALRQPRPEPAELRRYLFSILTLADGFVDELDLKAMAATLLPAAPATAEPGK